MYLNHTKLTDRGCAGAPNWIVEVVSPSNPGNDYIVKLHKYMVAGVREYWIINPMTEKIVVYFFENNVLAESYTFQDRIKVNIFSNLTINLSELNL